MPIEHQLLAVNGIDLSLYSAGPADGRTVWLLHGFPECWYAWHPQIEALSQAGYRVFAPEMRGYGQSSAPRDPAAYDLLTLCGDIQAAMDALGHTRVAVVGHDWGAPVAWHLALLEPARVQALGALSVPFGGRPKRPAIEMMRSAYAGRFHYILYFQQPGLAEAELDADIGRSLRLLLGGLGDLIERFAPNEIAVEQVFLSNNAMSALKLGQARGAAIGACVARDLPVSEYAARQVKLAVVGTGGADKAQVQHMVGLMLSLQGKLQADAADALAVAITHAHVRASANRLGVHARAAWGRR